MLGYRHIFHAGNHADILKHAVLTLTLQALLRKDKPFVYIDTHAGPGRYALDDVRALRTGEFQDGIGRWWPPAASVPALAPLLSIVHDLNPEGTLRHYPGSPLIAQRLLRPADRMVLMELHPADHQALHLAFGGSAAVKVERGDAFERLKAYLPPPERRGMVFIDPPYELKSDYSRVVELLVDAHRRWATGVYLLWFPVLSRLAAQRFVERIAATGIPRQLCLEYLPHEAGAGVNLQGSGMVIINPPFKLDVDLAALALGLGESVPGRCRLRWTVPE